MLHLSRSLNTSFSRCLLAGFACGILAAALNVVYALLYGRVTGFAVAMFDPLLIFVGFPLFFSIAGLILYEMVEYVKRGKMIFTVLSLLLTVTAIIVALTYRKEMEGLLLGVILITGLLLSFLLPFLATHARIFMDNEEFTESDGT